MKRTSILALLSALALPALGDDVKITVNPHSATEVAAAAAEGFSSVEEWYAHLNRTVILTMETDALNRAWASLSPEQKRFLGKPERKWEHWYNSLPSTTPRDIARRLEALRQHTSELEAWLPENLRSGPPKYAPGTGTGTGPTEPVPKRPPTIQESGTPPLQPPTAREMGTSLPRTPGGPPTPREMGTPMN
jgi:hypothetical protein